MNGILHIQCGLRVRYFHLILFLALFSGTGGCSLVGSGSPSPSNAAEEATGPEPPVSVPNETLEGFLEIDGGRINGTLTLTPSGASEVEGFFESPPDLVAIGRGRMRSSEIRLELTYEGSCPGRMVLVGRWQAPAGPYSGVARASDCTGDAEGTFLFR